MSRIGKLPIPILDKATATVDGQTVKVEGPKGKLEKTFDGSVNIELVEKRDPRHSCERQPPLSCDVWNCTFHHQQHGDWCR